MDEPWLPYAIFMGCIFIITFLVIAITVQSFGLGLTSVFQKTSLVVTTLFAFLVFDERISPLQATGLAMSLAAIYLINRKDLDNPSTGAHLPKWMIILPFVTFLLSGMIDALFYFVQTSGASEPADFLFMSTIFIVAASLGLLYYLVFLGGRVGRFGKREILGGIALGVPNFFAVYTFLMALGSGMGASVVVPVVSVGIILISTLVGILFFSEKMSRINMVGILIAVFAIFLISM